MRGWAFLGRQLPMVERGRSAMFAARLQPGRGRKGKARLPARKLVEEGAGGLDRALVCEREQVLVAGDEHGSLAFGEGQQVVVAGVGAAGSRIRRVGAGNRRVAEQRYEFGCLTRDDAAADLWVGERPL